MLCIRRNSIPPETLTFVRGMLKLKYCNYVIYYDDTHNLQKENVLGLLSGEGDDCKRYLFNSGWNISIEKYEIIFVIVHGCGELSIA